MVGAGLLARRRSSAACSASRGSRRPSRRVEGRHRVPRARRADRVPRGARLQPRRLRLHDLHRQLRPAAGGVSEAISRARPRGRARCCPGNRNFEGRIHPEVRAELPRLAAAGRGLRARRDDGHRPARASRSAQRRTASRSTCATSGRREREIAEIDRGGVQSEMFRKSYARRLRRRRALARARGARGRPLRLGRESTYVRRPPFFDGHAAGAAAPVETSRRARAGAARRLRHHRPHLARRRDQARQPGRALPDRARRRARGLQLLRRAPRQPRGDGARHVRQHPPAQPARRAGDPEGGFTRHLPDGEQMSIFDAAMRYAAGGRAAGRPRRARSTARARRATGPRRARCCSACAP